MSARTFRAVGLACAFGSLAALGSPGLIPDAAPVGDSTMLSTDRMIVRLKPSSARKDRPAAHREAIAARLSVATGMVVRTLRTMGDGSAVMQLDRRLLHGEFGALSAFAQDDPDVLEVLPDRLFQPALAPTDPLFAKQWTLASGAAGIDAPAAWDVTTGSASIVVAIVDTGKLDHADLAGRWVGGYDFVSLAARDTDTTPGVRDSNPTDPGDWVTPAEAVSLNCLATDSRWHGTLMAGVIGANANNGSGIAGINWVSKLVPVRVVGKCGGYESDIADGIRWAAGIAVPGVPVNPNPADVLNVSLTAPGVCSSVLQSAINEASLPGATVVVAAGNKGEDAAGYSPGNCDNVIAVGAVDRNGGKAGYTNFGARVSISAPGGKSAEHFTFGDTADNQWVHTTSDSGVLDAVSHVRTVAANDNLVAPVYGTSIAAAQVTGIVSLMLSANPGLTPTTIRDLLRSTARPFPSGTSAAGSQADCSLALCGAGMADARAAVRAANLWGNATMSIASGWNYVTGLRKDGMPFVWGSGITTPTPVGSLGGVSSLGGDAVLRADGTVWTGGLAPTQVPGISGVTAVATGQAHTLALRSDGTVWAWGGNDYGQLGDGSTNPRSAPAPIAGLANVIAIGANWKHSAAVTSDGTVWYWGKGYTYAPFYVAPTKVPVALAITGAKAVALSSAHLAALKNDGTVWTIGGSFYSELGNGTTNGSSTFVQVTGLANVTAISANFGGFLDGGFTLALKQDGTVWGWGLNPYGGLGQGNTTTTYSTPVQVQGGLASVVAISAGSGGYGLAVKSDGSVWGWGVNTRGQLGINATTNSTLPVQVLGVGGNGKLSLKELNFVQIAAAAPTGSLQISSPVALPAYAPGASIGITGGEYSVGCTSPFTASSGTLSGASVLCVRQTASAGCGTTTYATLTIAGIVPYTFSVTTLPCDAAPDPVAFATQENVAPGTVVTSNAVTITGIVGSVPLAVTGGTYAIGCGGEFTSAPGTIANGQTICLRMGAPSTPNTFSTSSLTVGALTANFAIVTGAATSGSPDQVSFATVPDVSPGSVVTSNVVTITGIGGSLPISVSGGSYSIGCTTVFTAVPGTITSGQSVCVRVNASGNPNTATTATLVIGATSIPFAVITAVPAAYSVLPKVAASSSGFGVRSDGALFKWDVLDRIGVSRVPLGGVLDVAASGRHVIALRNDGSAWSFGRNANGELGDGTTLDRTTPVQVSALANLTMVAGGDISRGPAFPQGWTLALRGDGTVWSWGYNGHGQLGDGSTADRKSPGPVNGLTGVHIAVSASRPGIEETAGGTSLVQGASYALRQDGSVWTWGRGSSTPAQLSGIAGVTGIAAGGRHLLVLKADQTVWATGSNQFGQLGNGSSTDSPGAFVASAGLTNVVAISAFGESSLALRADGTVWAWGSNYSGKLGNGTAGSFSTVPKQVLGLTGVTGIAMGSTFGLALRNDGVWIWGNDRQLLPTQVLGEQDDGTLLLQLRNTTPRPFSFVPVVGVSPGAFVNSNPVTVGGLGNVLSQISVAGGTYSINGSAFTASSGSVVNGDAVVVRVQASATVSATTSATLAIGGAAGQASTFFVRTRTDPGAARVVPAVAAGDSHTYLLSSEGIAYAAGYNGNGQLGNGTTLGSSKMRAVAGLSGLVSAVSGAFHGLGLRSDGTVVAWGSNAAGQLGVNSTDPSARYFVTVAGVGGTAMLSAGRYHSVALGQNGSVSTWGLNTDGQLGDGSTVQTRPAPVPVGTVTNAIAVAAGGRHTLALMFDGTVRAWGANDAGQLGDGSTTSRNLPAPVPGLANVVAIAAGDAHSLALKSDGTVVAWGFNAFGQLGLGDTANRTAPTAVAALGSNVGLIAAGANHTLAVKSGGALYTWGNNANSQLGNSANTNALSPVQLATPTGVTSVAGGTRHSAAITADRKLYLWGDNFFGQVGNRSGNYNPQAASLNVLRGDSVVSTGASGTGTGVGTGSNSGSSVLEIDGQSTGFDFGARTPGAASNTAGKYKNASAAENITGLGVEVTGTGFSLASSDCPAALLPDQECNFSIAFNPPATGSYQGELLIASSVVGSPERRALSGVAVAPSSAAIGYPLTGLDVPPQTVGTPSSAYLFTLVNTGTAVLSVTGVTSALPDFAATHNCASVAPGASCALSITFNPKATGLRVASLSIASNAGASPAIVVSGTGAPGNAVVIPASIPRLANISTRMQVLTGNDVLIGGFIIGGSTPKTVVVRARGPSLIPFGITNALANPTMQLFSGQTVLATSDDFGSASNLAALNASGFAPSNASESAILTTLGPGAYTAVVSGVGNTTGVGIIEVFEVDHPETPLANISTRGQVLTGGDVMIGGFVIQGDAPQTVIVRARGPSLIPFGITNALADPVLQLFSGQTVIASNDDWQSSPDAGNITTRGFAPSDAKESVILITLPPGAYTAIVSGKNGTTGVGIIEVFAQ